MTHPAGRPRLAALAVAASCAAAMLPPAAQASSHREAPFITTCRRSMAPTSTCSAATKAGRAGLRDPDRQLPAAAGRATAGPNYFALDPNALYEIHVDNNGDAREDITFQFRFKNTLKNLALDVGGQSVPIPLMQAGGLSAACKNGRAERAARPISSTWCAATAARQATRL